MGTAGASASVRGEVTAAGVGVVELDRPGALNALDLDMARGLGGLLRGWREDPAVRAVVVRSTSPKAFCAGGDILAMRAAGMRGDDAAVRAYFSTEYALNALIAQYPKPYTALVDGYAMGGGLGISVHGSALVATERAVLAMPETAIGFFPDIGATHFLPRLPGAVGWYIGLTGVRLSGAAAVESGLATHYVPAADLPALEEALTGAGGVRPDAVLERFAVAAPPSELAGHRAAIERCFSAPDLARVRGRLVAEAADVDAPDRAWAEDTLAVLDAASPMSLDITFDLLRAGADASLAECLANELESACRTAREPDFHEGVRAALVDKDRTPVWTSRHTPRATM
ncbi:putative Enoyl-CoA hydratase/isomerase [Actinacidiphila reveromycinica]|uniref:3-hydroxyisobutyryl-CoA hydrolase n=1 Tax=Actinacidiphila reveromycinica TaxID=659352 RepID=A0A7U3UZJ9_9ACTN|nr:enoyl-CoA hydratase/isomerase family protein [Streptomyces sp. SN-593]BBB01610.1 putative Enoyl-CoA hydratase/isomerase [Streptomyces sp. SN-593]